VTTRSYNELNSLPPTAFLVWEDFRTPADTWDANLSGRLADRQYELGRNVSRMARRVIISADGTWASVNLDGSLTQSYEGIGYHACTAHLLHGFLDGPAELVVYRYVNGGFTHTVIKPSAQ